MEKILFKRNSIRVLIAAGAFFLNVNLVAAQHKPHAGGGGGVHKPAAAHKPAGMNKPAAAHKPAANHMPVNHSNSGGIKKPVGNNNHSLSNNSIGGNKKPIAKKPTGTHNNLGNHNTVKKGGGNTVNINVDKSKNINNSHNKISNNHNINNSHHNTSVRRSAHYRPYSRPPHIYGGYRYNTYHPYRYHPYRPYHWGPVWHPWGFLVATLAVTAIVVEANNQKYHYDNGNYYTQTSGGYTVVQAPVGATITTLPTNYQTVPVNETTNNYYYGGTYYEKSSGGYTVVPPTAGTVVENLPEGGEEVKMGDITYVKVGDTYYQPFEDGGKNKYEVVDVESEG